MRCFYCRKSIATPARFGSRFRQLPQLSCPLACCNPRSRELRPELLRAIQDEPGLAIWVACRSSQQLGTLEQAAARLLRSSPILAGLAPCGQKTIAAWRALAIRTAAERHNDPSAEWSRLLYAGAGWLEFAGATVDVTTEKQLPPWLTEQLRTESSPRSAVESESSRSRVAARWDDEGPLLALAAQLPNVVSLVARLRTLDSDFEQAVEREKLAALRELAYGASHEINNPLANISTRAQTLLRDESNPRP